MNSNTVGQEYQAFFGIPRLSRRWDVSKDTIRRRINAGDLLSITIGGRRLIPASEVQRAELVGLGTPRKRHTRKSEEALRANR